MGNGEPLNVLGKRMTSFTFQTLRHFKLVQGKTRLHEIRTPEEVSGEGKEKRKRFI